MNDERVNLGDVCEITSSTRIFANEYRNEGIPFFRSKEIIELGNGATDVTDKYYISKERFNEIKKEKNIPQKGDIFLSAIGANLGEAFINNLEYEFYFKDGNIIWFRNFDTNRILSKYIYYWMKSKDFERQYNNFSIGAAQKALTIDSLKKYKIPILDIEKQQKIVKVLSEIDQKIINNSHINNNLEEFMKILYQRWFIEFDFPNEDGKPYKSSGGILVYNEELKQEIPENWKVENCYKNSLYTIIKPGLKMFKTKNYLATGNVDGNIIIDGEWVKYDSRESRANMQSLPNSIWFAKMKNSIKHITLPKKSEWFNEKYVLSTGFLGIKCNDNSLSYLHSFIYSEYFEKVKDMLAHGATQEAINNEDLKAIKLIVPEKRILQLFEESTKAIIQNELDIIKENQKLNSLKEYLLPLLMNGQINIDDIEI